MKPIKQLLVIIFIVITSCAPSKYYQLYKTESKDVEVKERTLRFENNYLQIDYDFWGDNDNLQHFLI